jgi:hypothetical protein
LIVFEERISSTSDLRFTIGKSICEFAQLGIGHRRQGRAANWHCCNNYEQPSHRVKRPDSPR